MNKRLLSICIPVYNRFDVFSYCLRNLCEVITNDIENEVEIIISDNASTDNIESIVNNLSAQYKTLQIKYFKNTTNLGMAKNIFLSVERASSEFCWVIGSDDFVREGSIRRILAIIRNQKVDFIVCNFNNLYFCDVNSNGNYYTNLKNMISKSDKLTIHNPPFKTGVYSSLFQLIDPSLENVFLGSLMVNIFRKAIWENVDSEALNLSGFTTLEQVYPHCYVFSSVFLNLPAYFINEPLITVGEGTREWSTETGNNFWDSSLPLIYFNILDDMVRNYKKNGLPYSIYRKCKNYVGSIAGSYFLEYCKIKLKGGNAKNDNLYPIKDVLKRYFSTVSFYKKIVMSVIKKIYEN